MTTQEKHQILKTLAGGAIKRLKELPTCSSLPVYSPLGVESTEAPD